ncbi:hypothetical protein [Gloeobacter kilaueensis]|uniref:Uncharacterized protein n=1 Tax=Gloeobacter kilaueensis (strain ATCC BAA-2537 / CCAP 1431/1 / ULC 316 / JS1) TaxID=1183438 RepID=U5QNF4_GLOK1|nr:hypothetical protein [Gloeobacter kilaueensis]AGY59134.1 hypothetical protein GKIL_2888 [Gloeobacter kilaueensis JS1]
MSPLKAPLPPDPVALKLQNLLSDQQYQTVTTLAVHRHDANQLHIIAWSLGFIDREQLSALFGSEALVEY